MLNDYKCPKCGHKQEAWTKHGEKPKCEKCGEELVRIWNFGGGIKTGDGYKG